MCWDASTLICPPPAYMTTATMSTGPILIVCCLVSGLATAAVAAAAAAATATAAAAAAAAGVINARSLIVAIEGRVQSQALMLLDDVMTLCKRMDCVVHVMALLGEGVKGEYLSLPATKVDKKMRHQSTSTVGNKEVSGKRRR